MTTRQIFAYSGLLVGRDDTRTNIDLLRYGLSLTSQQRERRVCYVPTAVGDSSSAVGSMAQAFEREFPSVAFSALTLFTQPSVPDVRAHLLAQDAVLVEGGSVVNLLAVWRAHGLDAILREAWAAGIVLMGASAGSICWHLGGPTDSFGDGLAPVTNGLGLLPFSNGVHDDFDDQPRRARYREWVASGELPAGYASEDGVGLHYVGTELHEAVTVRDGSTAWRVDPDGDAGWREQRLPTRFV